MTEFDRILNLPKLLEKKPFFLFGPRSTGKSHLIAKQLSKALVVDLLDGTTHLRLLENPSELTNMVEATTSTTIIVIDEIQKNPHFAGPGALHH